MDQNAQVPMSLLARLWFAWVTYFRILFDGAYATRVREAGSNAQQALSSREEVKRPALPAPPPSAPALQLLALLQREGRLIDFLQQDITTFKDTEVGAAARVVHEGCRKALRAHATIETVRSEEEGSTVTVTEGYSAAEVKLLGAVQGSAPFRGKLVHRGWRASKLTLPAALEGHDSSILAPAEVEL